MEGHSTILRFRRDVRRRAEWFRPVTSMAHATRGNAVPLCGARSAAILPFMSEPTQPHVLVVDDDREIRDLLSRFLTKHGMRVTAARDGAEMMKAIGERGIDIVVLDVCCPARTGWCCAAGCARNRPCR